MPSQGTPDMLVLKELQLEPMHGWESRADRACRERAQLGQGTLYPPVSPRASEIIKSECG